MIKYKYDEEKIFASFLAEVIQNDLAKSIIQKDEVTNADEATHLSKFFWAMVNK